MEEDLRIQYIPLLERTSKECNGCLVKNLSIILKVNDTTRIPSTKYVLVDMLPMQYANS